MVTPGGSAAQPDWADRLATARWLADRDCYVFPLRGKTPMQKHWAKQATRDVKEFAVWFIGTDYNLGIACEPSGLLVVDEDRPGGFAQFAASRGVTIPPTFAVRTRQGKHFYFWRPVGSRLGNKPGPLKDYGCDVRGGAVGGTDGGYVVGPGSIHPDDSSVRYLPDEPILPVAEMPEWLVAALTEPPRPKAGEPDPWVTPKESGLGLMPEAIPVGQRRDTLFRYASRLRAWALPMEEAGVLLGAVWQRCAQTDGEPFSWSEAQAQLIDVWARYAPGTSTEQAEVAEPDIPLYADVATLLDGGGIAPPVPDLLTRRDGHRLFYQGKVNALVGDSESGKTWITLAAMTETLLAGGRVLLVDVDHNTVEAMVSRLLQFGVPKDALTDQSRFRYTDAEDPARLYAVVTDAKRWAPDLVVVDSVGEVMAMLGLNSNQPDDYTTMHARVLKPLAAAGCAVVIVDHLPKNAETAKAGATGTNAKRRTIGGASFRVVVEDEFTPGRGGSCNLTVLKDRHGGVREHCPHRRREPFAGTFRLDDSGEGRLGWSIADPADVPDEHTNKVEIGSQTMVSVDLLRKLDPPPTSVRDVKDRMGWGSNRASSALRAYQQLFPGVPEEQTGNGNSSVPRSRTPMWRNEEHDG